MYGPDTGPPPPYTPPATAYTGPGSYGFPPTPAPYSVWLTPPDGWSGRGYVPMPERRSPAARVGLFLLRVFLACLPILSIGMLSWVPLVRTAVVRRRPADWVVLAVTFLLWAVGFYMVASTPDNDNGESDAGVALMLLLSLPSTLYFLVAEFRQPSRPEPLPQPGAYPPFGPAAPHWSFVPPAAPPVGAQAPTPIVPLDQVQADLDELSALLHRHERPAP